MGLTTRRLRSLLSVMVALVLGVSALGLVGCGGPGGSGGGGGEGGVPADDAIKVDEVEWAIEEGIEDGDRVMTFSYENGSDYTIVSVELAMVIDEEATSEEIEAAFPEDLEGHTVEELREQQGMLEAEGIVEPGAASEPAEANLTAEQRDLVVPDMLTVRFLSDGKLYEEYYDFRSDAYDQSSEVIDVEQWGEGELASLLPEPDGLLVDDITESETLFTFSTIGTTQEDFDAYVEACKEAGFTAAVLSHEGFYAAENEDGTNRLVLNLNSGGEISGSLSCPQE